MKRWNGWGDDSVLYPLHASALQFLHNHLGVGVPTVNVPLSDLLQKIPPSQLLAHPLILADPLERLLHARGQSLPDWVALRSGRMDRFPDGVAYPENAAQVADLITYARHTGTRLIPYGGGTSVVGHINPPSAGDPCLTVDLGHLNRLQHFDDLSLLATFGAGTAGPDLEAQLRARGCTLGHFPQSFEYSTLGGWVATRSSGQQSLRFGRIERLFAGGRMETPLGRLEIPIFPASAAGPDLREVVLGSEGRMGFLTEVTVRAVPLPEREEFHTVFFPDFSHGQSAVRRMLQAGLPLSMLRLSTTNETITTLALAGHENLIGALEGLLGLRGLGENKCMLLLGLTGTDAQVRAMRGEALSITSGQRGVHVGKTFGKEWHKKRFLTPYLRNTLWELGYAVDTVETATGWSNIPNMLETMEFSLQNALEPASERVYVFTHLSHTYSYGSSIYTTYLFRLSPDPEVTLQRWQTLKTAVSQAIVTNGGTISHQHGVGVDHLPYLAAEKGELGMSWLKDTCRFFDPEGLMNPGKLCEA